MFLKYLKLEITQKMPTVQLVYITLKTLFRGFSFGEIMKADTKIELDNGSSISYCQCSVVLLEYRW